jgi:hypothetical protein
MKRIHDDYAAYSIGVHCMAHWMNLIMQTLLMFPLVKHIEDLLQTLHVYFAHSPKSHLEFTKLIEIMETKRNKILCNIKTQWIFMLSPAKIVMAKYKTLLVKMAMDKNKNQQTKFNYMSTCVTYRFYLGLHAFCPC